MNFQRGRGAQLTQLVIGNVRASKTQLKLSATREAAQLLHPGLRCPGSLLPVLPHGEVGVFPVTRVGPGC